MAYLPTRTDDEQTRITGHFLPGGKHLIAKRIASTTLYKLLKGFSKEFGRLEQKIINWVDGRLINNPGATDFVEEWESALGIPDDDFLAVGTMEERRRQAFAKLAAEGVSTAADFEWLCDLMGFSVTVRPGYYYWLNPDSRVPLSNLKQARFTTVFETDFDASLPEVTPTRFPVPFPWVFDGNNYNQMIDFLVTLLPSNVNGVFLYSGSDLKGYGYFPYGLTPYGY